MNVLPAPASAVAERPAAQQHKILGIELLRFLSSVAVLVFHYQHFAFVGAAPADFTVSQQPFYSYLGFLYQYGFYGVEVFWCISGFIFFWKYGRQIAAADLQGYAFFVLRWSRLYPLHLVTLLFMAAMQAVYFSRHGLYFVYQSNDVFHFLLQLFLASNWGFQSGDSFNGPIWSISIEVLVYAIFFLSLRYISGSVMMVGCIALGAALVQLSKISTNPIFECLMFFYVGCLTAVIYQRAAGHRRAQWFTTVCAIVVLVALAVLNHFYDIKAKTNLVLFAPALIYLCVTHIPATAFADRALVPAGNMTYASYLLHVPLQIAVVMMCEAMGLHVPFYNPAFFLSFIVVTLLLSHGVYEYFEMPAQKMLRRLLLRRAPVAPSQT